MVSKEELCGMDLYGKGRSVLSPVEGFEEKLVSGRKRECPGDDVGKFSGGKVRVPGRDMPSEEFQACKAQHLGKGKA